MNNVRSLLADHGIQPTAQRVAIAEVMLGSTDHPTADELLAEARARFRADPDRYHPHIYGEHEVGGTSVLLIAAVPPEELGLPVDLPGAPMPALTWQALSRLPGVVATGAAFCLGMWWLINRRDKLAAERIAAAQTEAAPQHEVKEMRG